MMTRVLAAAAGACLVLVACEREEPVTPSETAPPPETQPTTPPAGQPRTTPPPTETTPPTQPPAEPGQQDATIAAEIRSAIMDDASLSTSAHECKVVVSQGSVTLMGTVESQAEKEAIEAKARAVTGVVSVDNQLEVQAP
jgi:hyperosmotically inducible periplasmic protein